MLLIREIISLQLLHNFYTTLTTFFQTNHWIFFPTCGSYISNCFLKIIIIIYIYSWWNYTEIVNVSYLFNNDDILPITLNLMLCFFRRKIFFVIKYFQRNHSSEKMISLKIFSSVWFIRKNH
jgi:hypothetical protein